MHCDKLRHLLRIHGVPENRTSLHITAHHHTSPHINRISTAHQPHITAHHQFMGITVPHSTCI